MSKNAVRSAGILDGSMNLLLRNKRRITMNCNLPPEPIDPLPPDWVDGIEPKPLHKDWGWITAMIAIFAPIIYFIIVIT